jgi:hypothetical protein
MKYYHGTSKTFESPSNTTGEDTNIFGEGLYTTSDKDIAMKYTKKGKGKTPSILEVTPNVKVNAYDMHQPLTTEMRAELINKHLPDDASFLAKDNHTLFDVLNELRAESRELNLPRYEVQDIIGSITDSLGEKGYNALSHKGGVLTGNKQHDVTIFKNPEQDVKLDRIKQAQPATEEMGYSEPVTKFRNWAGEMGAATIEGAAMASLPIAVHYANQATHGEFNPLDIKSAGEGSDIVPTMERGPVDELYRQKQLQSLTR